MPFLRLGRMRISIERTSILKVAKDAASYLSSYVNSNISIPPRCCKDDFFKPKHSQSKSFGVVLDCFQLPQILQKIERGDIVYYRSQKFDGESSSCCRVSSRLRS